MLLRSKAVHLRTIGRMGVVPGVFNINEPILFGAPIIMNPLFFLPFVLCRWSTRPWRTLR